MNLKILSLSPSPDDLFAVFRQEDGSYDCERVVSLALTVETTFRERGGNSTARIVPDEHHTMASGLILMDLCIEPAESVSNFCGYICAEDISEEELKQRFG